MHRDVVCRHLIEQGCTSIVSHVIYVTVDGSSVEVAACVGYRFPLTDVSVVDDADV